MTVIAGGQAYELDIATRQLPWDGMRRVSVNRLVLSGEAYNPIEDCWKRSPSILRTERQPAVHTMVPHSTRS